MPKVRDILIRLGNSTNRPTMMEAVITELIHVEMDLRFADGDRFRKDEYIRRFPDYENAAEEAWKRLLNLYPQGNLFSTVLARTDIFKNSGFSKADELIIADDQRCSVPIAFGPFQNLEVLNEGGFGVVCKALDTRSDQWVALKFPHKDILHSRELLAEFQEEANRSTELHHKGIVRSFSIEFHGGYVAIAMELIEGSCLKKTIRKERTQGQIVEIIAKIADALGYAHQKGIVHRDIKPANILLDDSDNPFIADFGLSLHENDQAFFPNQKCGTPSYMSPQLVEGLTRNLDGRTDIWSLGVIFYELLAKKRPFCGLARENVFKQIESHDPKPLREINPKIDFELQRICLKCLARPLRERYNTADELANDLRYWQNTPIHNSSTEKPFREIVPRGLRTYEKEDASFFLNLLPGPREGDGFPTSVSFWLKALSVKTQGEHPYPVCALFGPSGSGKSSFVKAAIVPHISSRVEIVYVECTQEDTEIQLQKAIQRKFPEIPHNLSLHELFVGLSSGRWETNHKKIVFILDQFEQKLNVEDNNRSSQLAKALRQLDGNKLQCLLVVKDIYWLSLTRFAKAIEIDLHQGKNCLAIDLFDKKHARNVLRKLGEAFERIPLNSISEDQNCFLDTAIDQLATGHHVICIHLVIFAEMFRLHSWTTDELKKIGGVEGVGETYLEYHFGENSRHPKYKAKKDQIVLVLEALLPPPDSTIRPNPIPEPTLRLACGCENRPKLFEEVIQILEDDLRLITKTNTFSEPDNSEKIQSKETCFQLVHDYFIPSIRKWVLETNQQTPEGRTKSRFSDLARMWETNQNNRFIPTPMEYLSVVRFLNIRKLAGTEKKLLWKASWFYLHRITLGFLVISLLLTAWFSAVYKNNQLAQNNVNSFLICPATKTLPINLLKRNAGRSKQILLHHLVNTPENSSRKLRIHIGLAYLKEKNREHVRYIVNSIAEASDAEGANIAALIKENHLVAIPMLEKRFDDCSKSLVASNEAELGKNRTTAARLAVVLATNNRINVIEDFLVSQKTRILRMEFVRAFANWTIPSVFRSELYRQTKNKKMQGTLLLAYGDATAKHPGMKPTMFFLEDTAEFHQNTNSPFVRSTIEWLHRINNSMLLTNNDQEMIQIMQNGMNFEMLNREITIEEFQDFINDAHYDSEKKPKKLLDFSKLDHCLPVRNLSKIDAILFCNWLSCKKGKTPCYVRTNKELNFPAGIESDKQKEYYLNSNVDNRMNAWKFNPNADGYRLPTRQEWELVSEFNSFTKFQPEETKKYIADFAWFDQQTIQPGMQKMPNEYGFYDLYGNTNEICWSINSSEKTPILLLADTDIYCGGGIEQKYNELINTGHEFPPYIRKPQAGFRIVRSLKLNEWP